MENYRFIMDIGFILLATKLLSMLSKRVKMPQVVGALLAGLLLGPACFGIVDDSIFIQNIASLGVIVLMFEAGLGTDINELKRSGKASLVIAVVGVLVPILGGWALGTLFPLNGNASFWETIFLGIILTATSVSITVETLKELGKLKTNSGNAILGAALIDDVLGIIGLSLVSGLSEGNVVVGLVLLKIFAFMVISVIFGAVFRHLFQVWMNKASWDRKRFAVISLAFCFFYAYFAEVLFGVADITGAFIAGLILSSTSRATFIETKSNTLSYMLLSPVFFASIGLKVNVTSISTTLFVFSLLFILVAIVTKIVGCGLGAKMCGYFNADCLRIGTGMLSRGEVGLVIADKGIISGVLHTAYLTPVILMVTVTTIITPLLLKWTYRQASAEQTFEDAASNSLEATYGVVQTLEDASETYLDNLERTQPNEA